jgi:L-threonylcarbamoyladenylate synthase
MKIISKDDFLLNEDFYKKEFENGKIFVFPTDTIYGIGCIFTNQNSIEKIKEAKKRKNKPFSIIVPNKEWIYENLEVNENNKKYINTKLPGKYTLILKIKEDKKDLIKINNIETIGIRILTNWFQDFIKTLKIPIIATSVNLTGEKNCTSINDLNPEMKNYIDYFINDGKINNPPSTIYDLTKKEIEKIR